MRRSAIIRWRNSVMTSSVVKGTGSDEPQEPAPHDGAGEYRPNAITNSQTTSPTGTPPYHPTARRFSSTRFRLVKVHAYSDPSVVFHVPPYPPVHAHQLG